MCPANMICASPLEDLAEKTVTAPFSAPYDGSATVLLDSVSGTVPGGREAGAQGDFPRSEPTPPPARAATTGGPAPPPCVPPAAPTPAHPPETTPRPPQRPPGPP